MGHQTTPKLREKGKEAKVRAYLMNGRSVLGILADLKKIAEYAQAEVVIVKANDDRLEAPEGFEVLTVTEAAKAIRERGEERVVLVANGGTTGQAISLTVALCEARGSFTILNLQREGVTVLANRE